jgi:hypothetical protein
VRYIASYTVFYLTKNTVSISTRQLGVGWCSRAKLRTWPPSIAFGEATFRLLRSQSSFCECLLSLFTTGSPHHASRPNNLRSMRMVYAGLPGVRVEPLHFSSRDISGERLLSMMKVDESTRSYP